MNNFKSHEPLEKAKYRQIRKWINEWLEDQTVYCSSCGNILSPNIKNCCDSPQLGKNIDHMLAVLVSNKKRSQIRLDRFGSNVDGTGRICLSLPPSLLNFLELKSREELGEKLWTNTKDFRGFMKAFPQFMVCEKV